MNMRMGAIRMDEIGIAKPQAYTNVVLLERIDVDNTGNCFYTLVGEQKLVDKP
jgi:hypothetical protein